jgi:hypothetical protein
MRARKVSRNSSEKPSTTRSGAWPNTCICRWCDSDMQWHLNPFSSRHCFWHIWQYHRSFCSPFALIRFAIAFGVRKSCFPIAPPPGQRRERASGGLICEARAEERKVLGCDAVDCGGGQRGERRRRRDEEMRERIWGWNRFGVGGLFWSRKYLLNQSARCVCRRT